ncbi:MAG TPA: hypothetical protein PLH79_19695, partial [bacterium]|nr:hypothetical protein [bacterium]
MRGPYRDYFILHGYTLFVQPYYADRPQFVNDYPILFKVKWLIDFYLFAENIPYPPALPGFAGHQGVGNLKPRRDKLIPVQVAVLDIRPYPVHQCA